jgi:hypothetical protein
MTSLSLEIDSRMRERGFEVGDAGHGDGVRVMIMVGKGTDSFQGQPPAIVFFMATVTGMMVRDDSLSAPATIKIASANGGGTLSYLGGCRRHSNTLARAGDYREASLGRERLAREG